MALWSKRIEVLFSHEALNPICYLYELHDSNATCAVSCAGSNATCAVSCAGSSVTCAGSNVTCAFSCADSNVTCAGSNVTCAVSCADSNVTCAGSNVTCAGSNVTCAVSYTDSKGLFPLGFRVDSQASPVTKCCELDVNSASYLWRVVDSESSTLCRVITLTKVITDSQHFVRRDACESTLAESQWKQAFNATCAAVESINIWNKNFGLTCYIWYAGQCRVK